MTETNAIPSRFFDPKTFDDPTSVLEAGSNCEADMLSDLDTYEKIEIIQELDRKLRASIDMLKKVLTYSSPTTEFDKKVWEDVKKLVQSEIKTLEDSK